MIVLFFDFYDINSLKQIQESTKKMIRINEINSSAYKHNISEVAKAIAQLQAFTNNLQAKVDGILKAQQTQFVNSYRGHMSNIRKQFYNLTQQLKKRDQQIQAYENQGKMSILIKRINYLQAQQKKLISDLQKKRLEIKERQLQKSIQKSQMKRLQQKIKQLLKSRAQVQQRMNKNNSPSIQQIPTFTTQIPQVNQKKSLSKMLTQEKSLKLRQQYYRSQKSQPSINPQSVLQNSRLQNQITKLRKQNRELISFNSKIATDVNQMQNFFIQTVNQIKRNISVRKRIKECTFDQFRKEDKLELLIKVLSNDDILFKLYCLIFDKTQDRSQDKKKKLQRPMSLRNKINLKRSMDSYFPSINSARIF